MPFGCVPTGAFTVISTESLSPVADVVLGATADGEDGLRQLILRQREEEIRLVLRGVDTAPELVPARGGPLDARVMARGDRVGSETAGAVEQRRELEIAVAVRAGQRRPAGRVLADEIAHHLLVELPLEIQASDKKLLPTTLGRVVTELLVEHFPNIVDYGFTSSMEQQLPNERSPPSLSDAS